VPSSISREGPLRHGRLARPPERRPTKTAEQFDRERRDKVAWLADRGLLTSPRIRRALLTVRREAFIPELYRDYAYQEVPLPIPGTSATISCPHSYPLFYEPLGLGEGHRFLEVGLGSGYGTALAREVVGGVQTLTVVERRPEGFTRRTVCEVLYVDLQGRYGFGSRGDE
jgi:protein-L-isoaspartate O-methyltransferase